MADLLTPQDWLDIRGAIKDVTDTFLKLPAKLHHSGEVYTSWNEELDENTEFTDYDILVLAVYDNTSESGKTDRSERGSADLAEGYVLVYHDALLDLGLIDPTTKRLLVNPESDQLEFYGERVLIVGANLVGPTETDNQLVKLHFKKAIQKLEI